ncbi:hypothetical protein [Bacillus dakarensis]|uniref:hypothetical protein n=1 Tax=Robertmurraya dakarensis TaxID=1926278 RepID=UPI0009823BBE|nr:hypothetical protein [Bacillus dakarensis]
MKTVTVDKLKFRRSLSIIEQVTLKNLLFKWIIPSKPMNEYDPHLLEYTEEVFAKMEISTETNWLILNSICFRYITLTEDNQIVIGFFKCRPRIKSYDFVFE